jgi:hypothetical protein
MVERNAPHARPRRRHTALGGLLLLLLCACGAAPAAKSTKPGADVPAAPKSTPRTYDASEFYSGRDRFPSALDPGSVPAGEAAWMQPRDEVIGVVVEGHARAYPTPMIGYHHVVNDTIEGTPVLVTYCVLCSAGAAFDPLRDGTRRLFGMEGSWRGTATMYDRETESIWLQLSGTCVSGAEQGAQLEPLPGVLHTTWERWRTLHPDTTVMALRKLNLRGSDSYMTREGARSGRDFVPEELRRVVRREDRRLPFSALLLGVQVGAETRAYPLADFQTHPVVTERLGGRDIVVWFDPASRSAAAFERTLDGRLLTFRALPGAAFEDSETKSRWSLDGNCVAGPLAGRALVPLQAMLSEWYGWVAVHPETTVFGQL